ncbi:MAG: hypothetical protein GC152_13850 [Alphaproteobacteria bacterium]|nr:hypothetical protein [Alphaproteobacteria bacterium]
MNKGLSAALFAAAALTGCGSTTKEAKERNPAPCPFVVVLEDAARQVEFDGEPSLETVAWSAEIKDASLSCRYYGDRPIEAELRFSMAAGKGPAARMREHDYKYFVAVTRRDMEVIAKKNYARTIKFDKDESIKVISEKIDDIVIPRARESIAGSNFEIVIGLVLTREQALYNRSGKSLKFPDL